MTAIFTFLFTIGRAIVKFFSDLTLGERVAIVISLVLICMSLVTHHYYEKTLELQKSVDELTTKKQELERDNKQLAQSIELLKQSSKIDDRACKFVAQEHAKIDSKVDTIKSAGEVTETKIRAKYTKTVIKKVSPQSSDIVAVQEEAPSDVVSPKDKEISAVRIKTAWNVYCSMDGASASACKSTN